MCRLGNDFRTTNSDFLDSRREFILPELNSDFRKIGIEKGERPELLFGDNLSQKIKDISETNKLGQAVAERNFVLIKTGPQKSQPFFYRSQGRSRGRYHKPQTAPYSCQRRSRNQQRVRRFNQNSPWQTVNLTDNEVSKIKDSLIDCNKTFQAGQIKNFVTNGRT